MKKMRILDRSGMFINMEWDYKPENNPEAYKKALAKLEKLNIKNAKIYEVAPICFWYNTPEKRINVETYE